MENKCIICDKSINKIVFTEFGINILKCKNCGHVFSSYKQNQDYDNYFKEEVISKDQFWWNEAHKKMYNDFCKKFIENKRGKLLDVGCGLGYFVKKVIFYPSWQVYGYEISKSAVDYAKKELGLSNVYCGKVENTNFQKKYFDIITLWDVIEHLPNPGPMLFYLNKILKDSGFLFIHTPNINIQLPKAKIKKLVKGMKSEVHYLEARDHINNYSVKTIAKILHNCGFNQVKFIHLPPIQSVSGSKNEILKIFKNFLFYLAIFIFKLSLGNINIDNLFVIARKHGTKYNNSNLQ